MQIIEKHMVAVNLLKEQLCKIIREQKATRGPLHLVNTKESRITKGENMKKERHVQHKANTCSKVTARPCSDLIPTITTTNNAYVNGIIFCRYKAYVNANKLAFLSLCSLKAMPIIANHGTIAITSMNWHTNNRDAEKSIRHNWSKGIPSMTEGWQHEEFP